METGKDHRSTFEYEMLTEYEFRGKKGIRGKYHSICSQGHSVRIRNNNGSVTVQYFPFDGKVDKNF
jgi:hypothetical protein